MFALGAHPAQFGAAARFFLVGMWEPINVDYWLGPR